MRLPGSVPQRCLLLVVVVALVLDLVCPRLPCRLRFTLLPHGCDACLRFPDYPASLCCTAQACRWRAEHGYGSTHGALASQSHSAGPVWPASAGARAVSFQNVSVRVCCAACSQRERRTHWLERLHCLPSFVYDLPLWANTKILERFPNCDTSVFGSEIRIHEAVRRMLALRGVRCSEPDE